MPLEIQIIAFNFDIIAFNFARVFIKFHYDAISNAGAASQNYIRFRLGSDTRAICAIWIVAKGYSRSPRG